MNRTYEIWRIRWTQPYTSWPRPQSEPKLEPEVEDLTLARKVLARIMAL